MAIILSGFVEEGDHIRREGVKLKPAQRGSR
jgi:hypothetical protein